MGRKVVNFVTDVLTLGATKQARDAGKAQTAALEAQQRAEMEARRIAASKAPLQESATLDLNTGVDTNALGALGLVVTPDLEKRKRPATAGLGTTGATTGLGSVVTSQLGFGG